jgi:hypothetical protein
MKNIPIRKFMLVAIILLCIVRLLGYTFAHAGTSETKVNGTLYTLRVQPGTVPAAPSFVAPSRHYSSLEKAENQSKVTFTIALMADRCKHIEKLPAAIEKIVYEIEVEIGGNILKVCESGFTIVANRRKASKTQMTGNINSSVSAMLAFDLPNTSSDKYEITSKAEVYFKGVNNPLVSTAKVSITCSSIVFTVNVNRGEPAKENYELTILNVYELAIALGPTSLGSYGFTIGHASWKVTADERFCAINAPGYTEQRLDTVNGVLIGLIPSSGSKYLANMSSYLKSGNETELNNPGSANKNEVAEVQHGLELDKVTTIPETQYTKTIVALKFTRNFLANNALSGDTRITYNMINFNCADMTMAAMGAVGLSPPCCKTTVAINTLDSGGQSVKRVFKLSLPDTLMDILQGLKPAGGKYGYQSGN